MTLKDKPPTRINAELIYYQLSEINLRLNKFEEVFVTKVESQALKTQIENLKTNIEERTESLSQEIAEIKKSKNLWGWLSPTLTAIVTATLTYLIIEFFKSKGR